MVASEVTQDSAPAAPANGTVCSIAYLINQYPALSMSFILREVLQLREMGFRIEVASVNQPDRAIKDLAAVEVAEAQRTYHLKRHGVTGALRAHCKTFFTRFRDYFRGLKLAVQLGGLDLRRLIFNLMYFTEAMMVGVWMEGIGLRHLHVHLGSQAATVGLYVRTVFGFGYSITVHGPDEFYDAKGQYLEHKIIAADFVCCISYFCRSQLMKLSSYDHWNKLLVSRLGVDPAVYSPRPPRVSPDIFEILCVGRLTPAKAQLVLIEAVDRLAQQGRRVRLRLIGQGPDEASLREQAARTQNPECIVFEGPVNQDHIRNFYTLADVFCIPSVAEGIPVVLMEAMAMEIPCVTTHITGIPELIRNGVDGLLVAPSDVEGLVGALACLMDDGVLRRRIARNGRLRILEHYNLRHNVAELAAIFATRIKSETASTLKARAAADCVEIGEEA